MCVCVCVCVGGGGGGGGGGGTPHRESCETSSRTVSWTSWCLGINHTYCHSVLMSQLHDDVIKWKHLTRYWPFVRGKFTGQRWVPHTKASDAERWCFLWSAQKKRLSKQSWGWWFETPSRPLWRHCYAITTIVGMLTHAEGLLSFLECIPMLHVFTLDNLWSCLYLRLDDNNNISLYIFVISNRNCQMHRLPNIGTEKTDYKNSFGRINLPSFYVSAIL